MIQALIEAAALQLISLRLQEICTLLAIGSIGSLIPENTNSQPVVLTAFMQFIVTSTKSTVLKLDIF